MLSPLSAIRNPSPPARPAPPTFAGLPEKDSHAPSRSAQIVARARADGAAAGRSLARVAGLLAGDVRGARTFATSTEGRRTMIACGWRGALAGLAAGVAASMAGGLPSAMVGAVVGAATGGLAAAATAAAVSHAARTRAAQTAAAFAPAGAAHGERAARAILHGEAHAQVSISHLPGMRRFGHWIILHEQVEPKGAEQERCHRVDARVYRGSQPGPDAFKALARAGFKTIVNLRYETDYEADEVKKLGMNAVYIPEAGMDRPTMEQTLEFLKVASDPALQPVYFHCYSGVDRTGTMAACYRIARQGWTAKQAIDEAVRLGMVEDLDGAKLDFIRDFEAWWKAHGQPPAPSP